MAGRRRRPGAPPPFVRGGRGGGVFGGRWRDRRRRRPADPSRLRGTLRSGRGPARAGGDHRRRRPTRLPGRARTAPPVVALVRAFVAVSFARGVAPAERDALVPLATRAVTRLAAGVVTTRSSEDGVVCVAVGVDADDWGDSRELVGVLVRGAYRSDGTRVTGVGVRAR